MASDLPTLRTSERGTGIGRPITSQTKSAQTQRCRRARGSASLRWCVRCIEDGINKRALDWAHIHGELGTDPWADFVPLCRSCHMKYDNSESRWGDPEYRKRLSESLRRKAIEQWKDPDMRRRMSEGRKHSIETLNWIGRRPRGERGRFK